MMNALDNAVISLFIVGIALLVSWLAFKVVAFAFGWDHRRRSRD